MRGRPVQHPSATGGLTSCSSRTLRGDCAAFGSPDYYSYVAGNLKQSMDDHYIDDVRKGTFPGDEHVYRMIDGEAAKLESDWSG